MNTAEELRAFYGSDSVSNEFLEFDRIEKKLSKRPDLHAFLLLDKLVPGKSDMICAAEHDQIWLGVDVEELLEVATEQQLIDLHRCGVGCYEHGLLCMFV
jgi:hypothetical protein